MKTTLFLLLSLFISANSFAETYNFIFDRSAVPTTKTNPQQSVKTPEPPAPVMKRWKVGASGFSASRETSPGTKELSQGASLGAMLSLGQALEFDALIGLRQFSKPFGILDAVFLPLRPRLFDVGVLLGMNTFQRAKGNFASLHAGAKANIHLNKVLDATATFRANLGYLMGEAGLAFRL